MKPKVFIIHYNRPTMLDKCMSAFDAEMFDLYVIDNCSEEYNKQKAMFLCKEHNAEFIPLIKNYGHEVVWSHHISKTYAPNEQYIVTDCDVIPPQNDWLKVLKQGLNKYPEINKIGLDLNISRIPDNFPRRAEVVSHEKKVIYRKQLDRDYQLCGVDTTLALYRAGYHNYSVWGTDTNVWHGKCLSLRTVKPKYEAEHLGWYLVPPLDNETRFYFNSLNGRTGHWQIS